MKRNKLYSAFLAASLLLSCFSPAVLAKGWDGAAKTKPNQDGNGTYIITSAEELAWFADDASFSGSSENAVLTADIDLENNEWMPIGKSNYAEYSGNFDGNGHTISGLKISGSSQYMGLFGMLTGTVSNLTVKGDIQYTGSGYGDAYAGGIAAYNKGTIENCVSDITIKGKTYVGGISGYNYYGTISGCINKGNISGSSAECVGGITGFGNSGVIALCANYGGVVNSGSYVYAGGIAGKVQGSAEIENVYNMGDVQNTNYAGGIVGYVYALSGMKNAYSAGVVTCSGTYRGGVAASMGYGVSASKITNCYFLKTDAVNSGLYAVQKSGNDREDLCGKSEAELKSAEFIASFSGVFEKDNEEMPINNGYPIFKWQNPNASYKAVIEVEPANAEVILANSRGEKIAGSFADGAYTFEPLEKGNYTYTVSCDAADYAAQSGEFTITNADYHVSIALLPNVYTVSFAVEPSYAEFKLETDTGIVTPAKSENGSYVYNLPNGSYTYHANAFGFRAETGSVIVDRAGAEKDVVLEKLPCVKFCFRVMDKNEGIMLNNVRTEIKCENLPVQPEADGTYWLPVGTYTYSVMCSGYAKCTGAFDVVQEDIDAGEKTLLLETIPSTAWDGGLDEPLYADGAWQIATGNELAWFAGFVNGTQVSKIADASYNAVLLKDIDLGGERNWTPIGLNNYSNAYSGTFDGNGHTITGLFISGNGTYQGLFGKNTKGSVIQNLTVSGSVQSTSTSSYAYIGGISGYNEKGTITGCVSEVQITGNGGRLGGICGASVGDGSVSAILSQCENAGAVSYETGTGQYKGGITGESRYTNISECVNNGEITGNGNFVGGIVGDLNAGSKLIDSYNTGKIRSAAYSFGGIAGRSDLYGSYGMINCYSAGEVVALSASCQNYGVLIGLYSGGLNTNCYCLIEENGVNAEQSPIGKVDFGTPEAVTVIAFADEMRGITEKLNTNAVWTQDSKMNNGYPILLWQKSLAEIPEKAVWIDGELCLTDNLVLSPGKHSVKVNYQGIGADVENGMLMLAVYSRDGALKEVQMANESYQTDTNFEIPEGGILKILFWKSSLAPVTMPVEIQAE